MKAFTLDAENNITAYGSRREAADTTHAAFWTEEGLAEVIGRDSKRQIAIWNSLTGVTPVKKFQSAAIAVRRIFAAIQTLEVAVVEEAPKPATAARAKKAKASPSDGSVAPREGSKVAQVIEMLKRPGGATLDELNNQFGWLPHTTRALMSAGGAIYKKFGLIVISEKAEDGVRHYRIAA